MTETTVSMVSNGTLVAPCIALDTSVVVARLLPFAGWHSGWLGPEALSKFYYISIALDS